MARQTDNVSAGTQVVLLAPGSKHPRGAVGVVTRTPTGQETHYLIRFPDGSASSLMRAEFDVLKNFKDRLTGANPALAEDVFNLETFTLYRCVCGSRAYGLDTEESDTDVRGVYLAPAELDLVAFWSPRTI